jgi:hypothetical protein
MIVLMWQYVFLVDMIIPAIVYWREELNYNFWFVVVAIFDIA